MLKRISNLVSFALLAAGGLALLPAHSAAQDYKIGVFDSARVIMESKVGQRAQQRLNAFKNERQKQITAREKDLEKLNNDFVNQSLTMNEETRQKRREALEDKRREFQRFYQDNERDLLKEMEKTQKQLQGQLTQVIEEFGARHSYHLIFERLQCVFNNRAVDITDDVIAAFDQKFGG